ncbi:hypothetical protein [Cupriavidus metallidurans]|uniref:hypothetical protein n=1 Tax=Cupriavidus metallidurans TaxID=119219 RepID=UPI0016444D77|nr:hypothetical protein [Cupriavidus metallidurans]
MKKILCVILAALPLGGCATWGQMDQGLNALSGRTLDDAINVFGMPSGEQQIAGRHYVQWGRSSSGFVPMSTPSQTYGNFNVSNGYRNAYGNYSSTTYNTTMVPVNYNCTITLELDRDAIIRRGSYQGNLGGCTPYIKSLNRYREQMGLN